MSQPQIAAAFCALSLVGSSLLSPAAAMPDCDNQQRFRTKKPYPCHDGWAWTALAGPFGGFQGGEGLARGHVGAEISLLVGPVTDDGAHSNFRTFVYGLLLDAGYLSGPSAFRGSLELQVSHLGWFYVPWIGVSAGPTLLVEGGEPRGGASVTVWAGMGLLVYGRFGADLPWRPYGEVGVMLKIPLLRTML